jgi:hypothetical protein
VRSTSDTRPPRDRLPMVSARKMHTPAEVIHGLAMPTLTVRHVTTYRYRQPVRIGEHRMMLRPRDCHDQRVPRENLEVG